MNTDHYLKRIRAGLSPESNSLVRFIAEETYLNFRPFSYVGHEYQEYVVRLIEQDPDVDLTMEKPSQIGASEIIYRVALGQMALFPGYSVAYLMPSISFSVEVLKTRMAPIIEQSPLLKSLTDRNVDSGTVKRFTNNSMLYALGASPNSKATLINRPITLAISDELDKLDYDVHTGLRSRQTHSLNKPRIGFSTPTALGVGINGEAAGRQLHQQIIKCHQCKKEYFPDYFEQVKIPGYEDPLESLTADKLRTLGLTTDEAYHHCPHCLTPSILTPEHRAWVVEDGHYRKIHVRLTPFDAPEFIKPRDLVTSQLTYSSISEFRNQALGLTARLADSTIDLSQIQFSNEGAPEGARVAGLDLGKISYWMSGVVTQNVLYVDHIQIIPVESLEYEVNNLIKMQNISCIVSDSLPFLDTVHKLSIKNPQFWPAIYTAPVNPQPELYKLKSNDAESVRQININKNSFFDHTAGMLMSAQIVFNRGPFDDKLVKHIGDMRRVRDYRFQDVRYTWIKSNAGKSGGSAEDHLWHTLNYFVAASKILYQGHVNSLSLPTGSLFSNFRMKQDL